MRKFSIAAFGKRTAISPTVPLLLLVILLAVSGSAGLTASTRTTADNLPAPVAEPAYQTPCGIAFPGAWTAPANTGVVDEAAVAAGIYAFGPDAASNTSYLGFKGNVGTEIVARYNVTNIFHGKTPPEKPGWKRLELGSIAPPNSFVEARMIQVSLCTGAVTPLCSITNTPVAGIPPAPKCLCCPNFDTQGIDFTKFLYYVEVKLGRTISPLTSIGPAPRAFTLRVY